MTNKTYQILQPLLEPYVLNYAEVIYEPGAKISHVYFPESGIISLLAAVGQNATLEVGIVGGEGVVGLQLYLGDKITDTRALVQGSGLALRMKAADFLAECSRGDELPKAVRLFTSSLMKQISQSAACNRYHPVEARMARWLLMTSDRMRSNEFRITQEFLSNMLGVRREAVSKAAGALQQAGTITYQRGELTIEDRPKLESMACACYALISQTSAAGSR